MFDYRYVSGHRYSLSATGLKKFRSRELPSRECAVREMYKFVDKHGIRIEDIWNDGHFVTYCCDNGAKIYISRI